MITPEQRANQLQAMFMKIVDDEKMAWRLTWLSTENMEWAAHFKYEQDYFSKMKKYIYEKESN